MKALETQVESLPWTDDERGGGGSVYRSMISEMGSYLRFNLDSKILKQLTSKMVRSTCKSSTLNFRLFLVLSYLEKIKE